MADENNKGRSSIDVIIELYKRDVDRTLLRENLKLTPTERLQQLMEMQKFAKEMRLAGRVLRNSEVLAALKASRKEQS